MIPEGQYVLIFGSESMKIYNKRHYLRLNIIKMNLFKVDYGLFITF